MTITKRNGAGAAANNRAAADARLLERYLYVRNRQRQVAIPADRYRRLVCRLLRETVRRPVEVGLTFVNDREMRRLNARYRGVNRPTDVLAFPAHSGPTPSGYVTALGDIVISVETARRQAKEHAKSRRLLPLHRRCLRLLIHGYLHLLGYDHELSPAEARRMRRMEQRLLALTSDLWPSAAPSARRPAR